MESVYLILVNFNGRYVQGHILEMHDIRIYCKFVHLEPFRPCCTHLYMSNSLKIFENKSRPKKLDYKISRIITVTHRITILGTVRFYEICTVDCDSFIIYIHVKCVLICACVCVCMCVCLCVFRNIGFKI